MEAIALDLTIPQPATVDDEDVYWALSTATTLWSRGERDEALKWLRRAANAASDRGHDLRAVELFKAAADVATQLQEQAAAAPRSGPPPEPTQSGVGLRQPASGPPPPPRRSEAPAASYRSAPPPVEADRADEATAPLGLPAPALGYDDLEEATAVLAGGEPAAQLVPNAPATPAQPPAQRPANRNGLSLRRPIRVAVVAGADGRIQLHPLTPGTRPPRGAALATLTPTGPRDAKLIETLLG